MNEKYYTRQEVADILEAHPMTIYREIKKGKLKAFTVGNHLRIKQSDLDDYIRKNKVKTK